MPLKNPHATHMRVLPSIPFRSSPNPLVCVPLDPKTMKNECFKPQYMGCNSPKNEGFGFPWLDQSTAPTSSFRFGGCSTFHRSACVIWNASVVPWTSAARPGSPESFCWNWRRYTVNFGKTRGGGDLCDGKTCRYLSIPYKRTSVKDFRTAILFWVWAWDFTDDF